MTMPTEGDASSQEEGESMRREFRVSLHADCVAHGGRDVYPDGKVGQEVAPPLERETDESTEELRAREEAEYQMSGTRTHERLRRISFPNIGTKWIPEWLLVPVQMEPAATSN